MKTTTLLKQVAVGVLTLLGQLAYSNSKPRISFPKAELIGIDTNVCLKLNGKMPKNDYKTKAIYTVELLHNNTLIKSVKVGDGADFNFDLGKNTWYAVKIKCENCVPKLISICTNIPKGSEEYIHKLYFELDQLINSAEAGNLDGETLDFPLAIFSYDKSIGNFDYNQAYSTNIKKELLINLTGKPVASNRASGIDKNN